VIAEVFVREDGYILIIWVPFYFVIQSAREGICSVCCSWFIFELDVILGNFRNISYNVWSDFLQFPIVS
jgi:hypothetical protein